MTAPNFAQEVAKAADEKKASDVTLLDVRGFSTICDFTLICSGENDKQTQAIAASIEDHCRVNFGRKPVGVEGRQTGQWILLDYGDLIVHIFLRELRDYYQLEKLWPKAPVISVTPATVKKA